MIERVLEKIAQVVFIMLFRFGFIQPVEQSDQVSLEQFYFSAGWFDLQEGFVEGFPGR